MDVRIWSIIISASVAILIAVLNHFIVTPIKEKKQRKRDQLKNLYAPAYALISQRINLVKKASLRSKKLMLGNTENTQYQSREYMESFFHERMGYAFNDFIYAFIDYSSQFFEYKKEHTEELVMTIVKGYNHLRKELGMGYNRDELDTGIPECIKEYRKYVKQNE